MFRYRGYSDYPELLALAVLVLIAAASGPTIARRVQRRVSLGRGDPAPGR